MLALSLGETMKRRSSAGGKARRGKAAALKRRNAPKANRGASIAGQETVVAARDQAGHPAVTVEPVGEFNLKGIRRPMAAYGI